MQAVSSITPVQNYIKIIIGGLQLDIPACDTQKLCNETRHY